MKNDNKQDLVNMSKSHISNLTKNLNNELAKVNIFSTRDELIVIFGECANIIKNLNKKISSFEQLLKTEV